MRPINPRTISLVELAETVDNVFEEGAREVKIPTKIIGISRVMDYLKNYTVVLKAEIGENANADGLDSQAYFIINRR